MEFLQLIGFALASLAVITILRQYNPTYSVPAGIACCTVLLILSLRALTPLLSFVERLAAYSTGTDIGIVFKAVAIAVLTQTTQDLCREAGHTALAGRVEFAGKIAILLAAMPLFVSLADTILELLQ